MTDEHDPLAGKPFAPPAALRARMAEGGKHARAEAGASEAADSAARGPAHASAPKEASESGAGHVVRHAAGHAGKQVDQGREGLREARRRVTVAAIAAAAAVALAVLAAVVVIGGASSTKIGEGDSAAAAAADEAFAAADDRPLFRSDGAVGAGGDAADADAGAAGAGAGVEGETPSPDLLDALDALSLLDPDGDQDASVTARTLWRATWGSAGGTSEGVFEATPVSAADYPAVDAALAAYEKAGYDASFVLYSFGTGAALGFNLDRTYFCASTVKAPFSAYVLEAADAGTIDAGETLVETEIREGTGIMAFDGVSEYSLDEVVEHTIMQSDNTGYRMLWCRYGGDGFDAWAGDLGVAAGTIAGAEYPSLAARDLARLWVGVVQYLSEGSDRATLLASLLSATDRSFLRPAAEPGATVLSKPGFETNTWYPGDPFDYGALHDAGIVADEEGAWLVVVMSNANYDSNSETGAECLVEDLIAALLDARAELAGA